jgi:hypothetical protein
MMTRWRRSIWRTQLNNSLYAGCGALKLTLKASALAPRQAILRLSHRGNDKECLSSSRETSSIIATAATKWKGLPENGVC